MEDWQNQVHSLGSRAKFAFDNKILTDCEFVFGNKEKISCHKLVLAVTSPVFHAMFYGGTWQDNDHPIEITDIDVHVFKQMIQYIYVGQSNISCCKNACDLYLAAKKYILLHLEKQCIDYLLAYIDKGNAIQLYEFAEFHGEEELEKMAIKKMQCHTTSIIKAESFLEANESSVALLLSLDRLNISTECELLAAIERWAHAQSHPGSAPRAIAAPLIRKLRLLTVTMQEFVTGVASSTLLTDSEKLSLLLRIVGAELPPMMNGLCEKRGKRKPCRELMITSLEFQEISEARCDGSEWFTSVFTTNTRILLAGIEISLQKHEEDGLYKENLMVKVGLANQKDHFAEASLLRAVPYNSEAQVMLPNPPILEPNAQYAVHVFLCSPGIYPLGYQTNLSSSNNNVEIEFVSHTSWEQCHPWNTTVLSSLIYSDVIDN